MVIQQGPKSDEPTTQVLNYLMDKNYGFKDFRNLSIKLVILISKLNLSKLSNQFEAGDGSFRKSHKSVSALHSLFNQCYSMYSLQSS